jgi:hypothetical protein
MASAIEYVPEEVQNLKETLECHQRIGRKYVDFTDNLIACTWDDVRTELQKAQKAAAMSKTRGNNLMRKGWRIVGATSSMLAPGLAALPDYLCVLNGGLAVIFSVRF